jgi:hypothetical protein
VPLRTSSAVPPLRVGRSVRWHSSRTLETNSTQGASRSGGKYQSPAHWGSVPLPASCREHRQLTNKPAAIPFVLGHKVMLICEENTGFYDNCRANVRCWEVIRSRREEIGNPLEQRPTLWVEWCWVSLFGRGWLGINHRQFETSGLTWPPTGAACPVVRLPVSNEGVVLGMDSALARPPRTSFF